MSHRQIAFHRMLLDSVTKDISPADTHACSQIPRKDIASSSEERSSLNFRRQYSVDIFIFNSSMSLRLFSPDMERGGT